MNISYSIIPICLLNNNNNNEGQDGDRSNGDNNGNNNQGGNENQGVNILRVNNSVENSPPTNESNQAGRIRASGGNVLSNLEPRVRSEPQAILSDEEK